MNTLIYRNYVLIKPRVGGIAFWRAVMRYLADIDTFSVIALQVSTRTWVYLFPRSAIVEEPRKLVRDGVAEWIIELHEFGMPEASEHFKVMRIAIEKLDRWTRILHIDDGVQRYTVYPCRRIKEKIGRDQERAPQSSF